MDFPFKKEKREWVSVICYRLHETKWNETCVWENWIIIHAHIHAHTIRGQFSVFELIFVCLGSPRFVFRLCLFTFNNCIRFSSFSLLRTINIQLALFPPQSFYYTRVGLKNTFVPFSKSSFSVNINFRLTTPSFSLYFFIRGCG